MEGIWTGVRIFLARFCGVSKWYRAQYAAVFGTYILSTQLDGVPGMQLHKKDAYPFFAHYVPWYVVSY